MEEETLTPEADQPSENQDEVTEEETPETEVDNETDEPNVESQTENPTPETPKSEQPVEEEPEWKPEPIETPKLQTPKTPRPRMSQFMSPDGTIDVGGYEAAVDRYEAERDASINQTFQAVVTSADRVADLKNAYREEWGKAEGKFPELKANKQLKDMVQAIHANSAQPGFKYLSPLKAAEQLFAIRGDAKADGMKAAQATRTVQAAAGLGNPNPPAPAKSGDRAKQLKTQMTTGNRAQRQKATTDYIAELMKAGKI